MKFKLIILINLLVSVINLSLCDESDESPDSFEPDVPLPSEALEKVSFISTLYS